MGGRDRERGRRGREMSREGEGKRCACREERGWGEFVDTSSQVRVSGRERAPKREGREREWVSASERGKTLKGGRRG